MPALEPFTDLVKALRELRVLVVEVISDAKRTSEDWQIRQIKRGLRTLRFKPKGMLGTLRELVEMDNPETLLKLRAQFDSSEKRVGAGVARLERAVERFQLGDFDRTNFLEALIKGKAGKGGIRGGIGFLLERLPLSAMPDDDIRHEATALIAEIDKFNQALEELHDSL